MRESDVIHHALWPDLCLALRKVDEFQHKPVAHQIRRTDANRSVQLQKLRRAFVGQFELPPELEPEQALVEPARTLPVRHAQTDVVEDRSVTGHSFPPKDAKIAEWAVRTCTATQSLTSTIIRTNTAATKPP